ncbi:hypothetical protein [Yoonia sp.]|uniref:hypothetical protein n=1 Tax=Yoonia sp. TaxID=2212373 RepID=UPI0025E1D0F2|nr:hypothetical protein [Yoonia sp.]
MDILVSNGYNFRMLARLVTMLSILAITVVTTVNSAHAAGMGSDPYHATHLTEIMHSMEVMELACDAEQACGSDDAAMCEFVCTGISAFLTSSGAEVGVAHALAGHDSASAPIHVGRTPGLNKRPPKLRLL